MNMPVKKFISYVDHLQKHEKLTRRHVTFAAFGTLLFLALAITLPTYLLKQQILWGHAAGFTAVDPENGTLAGNVTVVSDTDASGGKYVRLGAPTTVVIVPSSIASDCSADITDPLNSWLGTVPDNATIIFTQNGCYQLDRTLKIENRNNLTLEGNGATFQRKTPTPPELQYGNPADTTNQFNQHVAIKTSTSITIRDLNIVGLNTTSDIDLTSARAKLTYEPEKFGSTYTTANYGEAGFYISKSSNTITLEHISVDGVYGDGITLGGENQPLSKNVTIIDALIDRNGRQGITMSSVENVLVDNARIMHSHATGFDLEPNGAGSSVKGVEIRNSSINTWTIAFSVTGSQLPTGPNSDDLYIHDNNVRYTLSSYPWLNGGVDNSKPRSNWRVINNTIQSPTLGITVIAVAGLTIEGNHQTNTKKSGAPAYPGVKLTGTTGSISIRNNEMIDALNVYTEASSSAQVTACSNKLISTGAYDQPSVCP